MANRWKSIKGKNVGTGMEIRFPIGMRYVESIRVVWAADGESQDRFATIKSRGYNDRKEIRLDDNQRYTVPADQYPVKPFKG